MELCNINKVFFIPGDRVVVKHDIENKPVMIVLKVLRTTLKDKPSALTGIICYWFDDNKVYREQKFNTKDLEKY